VIARASLVLAAVLAPVAAGCRGSVCGVGTEDVGGVCVPVLACGPGTVEDGGTCWPTVGCGPATYEVDGGCAPLPPEDIVVDVPETAEPNDPFAGGPLAPFVLPAEGAPPVLVGGNVGDPALSPPGGDLDGFSFQGTAGTLVRLAGVSRGAAAVAFVVQGWEPGTQGFVRFGFDGAGGSARRDVLLPADGPYALIVSEAANVAALHAGGGAVAFGGPGDDYAVSVETVALPAPAGAVPPAALLGTFDAGALPFFAVAAAPGAALHFTATTSDPELELTVLALDAATLALLVPASGLADAIVPLDLTVLLVPDFVFGDGVDQGWALSLALE